MIDLLPHWLLVLLGAGALSIPFQLFMVFQCGSLNSETTEPFLYYQFIVNGINAVVVGAYVMAAGYQITGMVVASFGLIMSIHERIKLGLWYRSNPQYRWRILKSLF